MPTEAANAAVAVNDRPLRVTDEYTLIGVKRDEQAPDATFYNELDLTLVDAAGYLEGEHPLTLTNRDGRWSRRRSP